LPYTLGNVIPSAAVGKPPARRTVADNLIVAVHKSVAIADSLVVHTIERDIVLEVVMDRQCMIGPDTAAAHTVVLDSVDRVQTVVDILTEDWYTALMQLEHSQIEYIVLFRLVYCHIHRKTAHCPHCVSHNCYRTLLPFVLVPQHAHRDHTGYKTSCSLEPEHDMQDKQ
jgi:hypothetical protein